MKPGVQMPHCSAAFSRNDALQRMQFAALRDAFDGGDAAALGLDAQHQARGHDAAVQDDGAGAAIAVVAALLGAGQAENVAQALEQALPRLAQKFLRLAVDRGLDANFARA